MKHRIARQSSMGRLSSAALIALCSTSCSDQSASEIKGYVFGEVSNGGKPSTGGTSSAGGTGSMTTGGTGAVNNGGSGGSETSAGGSGGSGDTGGTAGTAGTGTGGTGDTGGTGGTGPVPTGHFKMLVYRETRGYHHPSIAAGIEMLTELAATNDFEFEVSDGDETEITNDVQITAEDLAPFDIVFFLNPTGDIFGDEASPEREVFKTFLLGKKAFAGVHAATDTEYGFPWYEDLVGEIYDGHSAEIPVPSGTINIEEAQQDHPAMAGIPSPWTRNEEWYKFQNRIDSGLPGLTVLMRYGGGASTTGPINGQPLAWTRCLDGIRSFYTALGHESSAFSEPLVRQHILGGILWAVRRLDAPNEACP
jgi:type 1 glutamine amidotransferase